MNSNQSLVSVIMPTYNTGKYIIEAIESVLSQTYINIELIIVNDGSTDNTSELVGSLTDRRISYYELKNNMGRGYARNYAVSKCNGDYIAISDADDISLPERIKLQVEFLEDNKDIDIVGAQLLHFSDRSKPAKVYQYPEMPSLVNSYFQKGVMGIAHASCMLRKKCFNELRYEDSIAYNVEDFELFLRLNRFHKMASLSQPLVLYRNEISGISLDRIKHHNLYHHYSIYVANAKLEQVDYMSYEKWAGTYRGSFNHQFESLLTFIKVRAKNAIKHLK